VRITIDLAGALAATALRLSARAAPAVAIIKEFDRWRLNRCGSGRRWSAEYGLPRLHKDPELKLKLTPTTISDARPSEMDKKLLRGGAASPRAHRQGEIDHIVRMVVVRRTGAVRSRCLVYDTGSTRLPIDER